ncbi:nitrile hydratase subunit alpha [Xylophilus rhododendri]|uniref:Nitrile hydratase subunit alpha n=1 Tax=Xylophilus rhododendri TaxID=2697032 RepID=A0A857J8P2_9BURK|nr:nitrile hydratase subunit alpha [Xylophilus rhododendri]QHI99128.1 nitrile hydratase subunit alpha [Xylophilus rhododendri]
MHFNNEKERTLALRDALIAKGMHTQAEVDAMEEGFETWTPANGAAVVARAWCDPDFKQRLLADALGTANEVVQPVPFGGWDALALENTDKVHNVLVCTLCSCTIKSLIGQPPHWYKSLAYRARLVREPRAVLGEFGLTLAPEVEIKVWDITAETGYMVIPVRPAGTEGWSEAELASIVTKKSLIGVEQPDVRLVRRDGQAATSDVEVQHA